MKQRARIIIRGRVRGIFYRAFIKEHALRLGLRGYVKNLSTGEVEAVFEGEGAPIKEMISRCKKGPPLAKVFSIKIEIEKPTKEFKEFSIAR